MHVIRALPTIDATISYIPINGIKFYFPAFFSFPWDETASSVLLFFLLRESDKIREDPAFRLSLRSFDFEIVLDLELWRIIDTLKLFWNFSIDYLKGGGRS